jgi:heme o synthase
MRLRDWYELCKPRVVFLMLITVWVGMLLATHAVSPLLFFYASLGIMGAASAGAVCNQIVEHSMDKKMQRTQHRPLANQRIPLWGAGLFAGVLGAFGLGLLYWKVNALTCFLTLGSLIGYAIVYTLFLKKATPQNIVIGGLAGAMPPLLGWTAVTGAIEPHAWLLVLIVFIWTPPHFWALALYRQEDYARSPWPMLPVTHGAAFTKMSILLYTILLNIVTLLPVIMGMSGWIYGVVWGLVNSIFFYYVLRLCCSADSRWGLKTFRYSIVYLFLVFIGLLLDHYV